MLKPAIDHGPWMIHGDIGAMTIGFSSASPCGAALEYRKMGADWEKIFQSEGGQIVTAEKRHIFHLSDLTAGAEYEFRAIAFDPETGEEVCKEGRFTAFDPERKDYSFLVLADLQFPVEKRLELLKKYYEMCHGDQCDFTVFLGDLLGSIDDFERDGLSSVIDLLQQTGYLKRPIFLVRGNHEMRGKAAWEWNRWFGSPEGNSYSTFRQGPAAFLLLDSWTDQPSTNQGFQLNLDQEFLKGEKQFLEKALFEDPFQSAPFKLVMAHGASHSHIDQFYFLNPNMRNLTDPYFKGKSPLVPIHAWICGHIHHYIRTIPGKAQCASISCPPQPVTTPENYSFPVLTADGPDVIREIVPPSGIQSSVFLVHVSEKALDIQAWSEEKGLLDHILIQPDRKIVEKRSIPHYNWKSENPEP